MSYDMLIQIPVINDFFKTIGLVKDVDYTKGKNCLKLREMLLFCDYGRDGCVMKALLFPYFIVFGLTYSNVENSFAPWLRQ